MATKILEKVFDEAAKLPEEEQKELAEWIIAELESEKQWSRAFADSLEELGRLADEALREDSEGRTEPLDPEKL